MSTIARRTSPIKTLLTGFVAGGLAVLVAHQVTVLVLSSAGMVQATPYSMTPVGPLGVPTIVNSVFWGGLWGALFGLIAYRRSPGLGSLVVSGIAFGLLGPLLVNWFLVSPLKGRPMAAGFVPAQMLAGVLIAGSFGLGLGLIYGMLRQRA